MTSALEITSVRGGLLRENPTLARSVNPERVKEIAQSIEEIGLLNPIIVRPRQASISGQVGEGFEILAGVHRFRAMFQILNWELIPVRIVSVDDLRARLITLDENLVREELGEVERAEALKERKDIYEALHPETKHGGDRVSERASRHRDNLIDAVPRFTTDASNKTGRGERSIQRDIEVAEKISTSALALIKGTVLDTQRYLHKLKHVPKEDQVRTVQRDLADPANVQHARKSGKPVPPADPPLNDFEAYQQWLAEGVRWLNKGSAEWRSMAHDHLFCEVPVMDRKRA